MSLTGTVKVLWRYQAGFDAVPSGGAQTVQLPFQPGAYDTIVVGTGIAGANYSTVSGAGATWVSVGNFGSSPGGNLWFGFQPTGNQVQISPTAANPNGCFVVAIIHGLQPVVSLGALLGSTAAPPARTTQTLTHDGPACVFAAAPSNSNLQFFQPTVWSGGQQTTSLRTDLNTSPNAAGTYWRRDIAIDYIVVDQPGSVSATISSQPGGVGPSGTAIVALPCDTTQVPDPSLPLTYPRAVQSTPFLRHYWRMGAVPVPDEVGGLTIAPGGGTLPLPEVGSGLTGDGDGAIVQPTTDVRNLTGELEAIGNQWSFVCLLHPLGNLVTQTPAVFTFPLKTLPVSGGQNRALFLVNQTPYPSMNSSIDNGLAAGGQAAYTSFTGYGSVNDRTFWWAGTWDGELFRYYIDGVQVPFQVSGAGATAAGISGTQTAVPLDPVGMRGDAGPFNLCSGQYHGTFDEFALFSTPLSADQVARLYEAVSQVDVPTAPQNVTATASINAASVTWTAPASTGGSPVTGYTISWPGGVQTAGATATGAAINGLTAGTSYTFSVAAVNAAGTGTAGQSNAVTPTAPAWTGPLTYPKAVQSTAFLRCYWRLGGPSPWVDVLGGPSMTTQPTGTADPAPVAGLIAADDDGGLQISTSRPQATLASLPIQRWSLCVLFKAPTASGNPFVMQVAPTAGGWIQIAVQSTGQLLVNAQAAFGFTIALPGSYADGNPHLCVLTWDGSIVGLYGDLGNSTAVPAASAPGWTPGAWSLGANTSNGGLLVGGVVDEAALFSEALTTQQIARLYQAVSQADLPQVPQNVGAQASFNAASVSWTAPAWDGGSAVTGYTITWPGGSQNVAASPTNTIISGLTAGTSYTFSVAAVNAVGTGPAAQTSGVVPTVPPDYGSLPLTYPRAVTTTPFLAYYWRLGGSGPTWLDSIGGVVASSMGGTPTSDAGLIAADDDGALLFAANGSKLTAAISALGNQWTWSCLLSTQEPNVQFLRNNAGNPIWMLSGGTLQFQGGSGQNTPGVTGMSNGQTRSLIATFDGATIAIWVDGVLRSSLASTDPVLALPAMTLSIGSFGWAGFSQSGITLDELAIFSVALTPEQVQRLYQAVSQPDLPDTPPNALVTAGPASAMLRWDASWDGGSPMRYVVTWTPNGTPE